MEYGQKSVRRERAEEQTLFAFPIADELAPCTPMHPAWRFAKVVDLQLRPIFAETIGEDSICRCMATQIEHWLPNRLYSSDGLHRQFLVGSVPYRYLDRAVGALVINLNNINKIGFALESRSSDGYGPAVAKFIGECSFGCFVTRVLIRAQPLVINLRCHSAGEHGLAARHRQLVRTILSVDGQGELVIRQLLGHTRRDDNQRPSDNRGSHIAEQSANTFRHGVSPPLHGRS